MLWDQVFLVAGITIILIILLIIEKTNLVTVFYEAINYIRNVPKGAFLKALYRYFLVTLPTVLCFSLPIMLPLVFVRNGVFVNIISHYIGWVSGLFFPICLDYLAREA
jgi:hypothetical protein